MKKKIRVLITDDHAVVREGMKALIAMKPDMEVVGEAVDGVEAVEIARLCQPDVILLDLKMPRQDGLVALRAIKRENPNARVLVLTSFDDEQKVRSAISGGAEGYILKESSPKHLIQAIRDIYNGGSFLDSKIAYKVMAQLDPSPEGIAAKLTERELQVLKLVAEGLMNEEIGEQLEVSERTIGKHVSKILKKLKLRNRTQATLYALREGLVSLH